MLMFIVTAFSLLELQDALWLEENDVCHSQNEVLQCFCKNRENVSISASMKFDIKRILVRSCGTVSMPLGAITHLQLDEIELTDIDVLEVMPFALVGVQTIDTLKIENITDFRVKQHGFAGLFNVTNFIIRNVTSDFLSTGSFGGILNVQNFLIENAFLGEIQERAFILTNVSSMRVINTQIRVLESLSFLMHDFEEIVFENCDIRETYNRSISVSEVNWLTFSNCRFGIVSAHSIYTKSLSNFKFKNCSIDELETDALALVDATRKFIFSQNIIKIAEEFSLNHINAPNNDVVDNCCNLFTCDCSIYWLWMYREEIDKSLFENSFCFNKPGVYLSDVEPVLDSNQNCMTLDIKRLKSESKPVEAGKTEDEKNRNTSQMSQERSHASTCSLKEAINILFLIIFSSIIL